ncbi:MAG: phosphatase [Microbacterium sp. SCN 70-200]|nr:MAG: phosphatase [Microbacterium sp. SCN 70-200]OJV81755.1 MAG: phosphatase [Microbacterium sp. 70-16]
MPEPQAEPAVTALPVAIAAVARDLSYRFSSTFSTETVSRYVAESYLLLSHRAQVRTHLAALTARYAADRLDALASASGLSLRGTPEVLFVCVQNAGRSQIAAAYLRHLAGGAVHVRTAGSEPAMAVHPRVREVLAEVGIPLSDDFPKPLTDEVIQAADYVVTMGCGDACPVYPGRRYMDWELEDPLTLDDAGLRTVRDRIRAHVENLLAEMGIVNQPASR